MSASTVSAAVRPRGRQLLADYLDLTKPKVQSLLLLTTVTTMEVAGNPSVPRVAVTCLGGYLSAGGAGAVNHYWDRDIDARMRRTANRPIPSGRVRPAAALRFGLSLAALSFLLMSLTVGVLAASLALAGFAGYVGIYTIWLKRRTHHNIVIGGAAGAFPPLVGWAAVTGHLGIYAWLMFALVFYWTPPHFWALALLLQNDYAAAGVPMLPVVHGEDATRRQIFLWTIVMVGVTALPCAAGLAGWTYFVGALILNAVFVALAFRLWRTPSSAHAKATFHYSLLYLALVFALMAIDAA
jgi:heme o synthase